MTLRPLTAEDAPEYFAFRLGGLEESPLAFGRSAEEYRLEPMGQVAARLREEPGERVTLGAFGGGQLVGAMTLVREPGLKQRHRASILAVYVAPASRGAGVGRRLLTGLLGWAGQVPGLLQVHLAVSVSQTAARRLYAAHGFTVYGRDPRALRVAGQDVDEDLMVRFLDEPSSLR